TCTHRRTVGKGRARVPQTLTFVTGASQQTLIIQKHAHTQAFWDLTATDSQTNTDCLSQFGEPKTHLQLSEKLRAPPPPPVSCLAAACLPHGTQPVAGSHRSTAVISHPVSASPFLQPGVDSERPRELLQLCRRVAQVPPLLVGQVVAVAVVDHVLSGGKGDPLSGSSSWEESPKVERNCSEGRQGGSDRDSVPHAAT
ncbi:unnamed protein product, partial [Ectocarpus sp. 12 AP-2014]